MKVGLVAGGLTAPNVLRLGFRIGPGGNSLTAIIVSTAATLYSKLKGTHRLQNRSVRPRRRNGIPDTNQTAVFARFTGTAERFRKLGALVHRHLSRAVGARGQNRSV
jgi:hypothetical protein